MNIPIGEVDTQWHDSEENYSGEQCVTQLNTQIHFSSPIYNWSQNLCVFLSLLVLKEKADSMSRRSDAAEHSSEARQYMFKGVGTGSIHARVIILM